MINTNIGVSKHHHVFYWSYNTNIYTSPYSTTKQGGYNFNLCVVLSQFNNCLVWWSLCSRSDSHCVLSIFEISLTWYWVQLQLVRVAQHFKSRPPSCFIFSSISRCNIQYHTSLWHVVDWDWCEKLLYLYLSMKYEMIVHNFKIKM